MLTNCYSIRMRAAEGMSHELGGKHISGGERLIDESQLQSAVSELLHKANSHSRGNADFIQITVEKVFAQQISHLPSLQIRAYQLPSVQEGRRHGKELLSAEGVSNKAIDLAFDVLCNETNLRGAVILDALTGERLDERQAKGIRVSRMDWDQAPEVHSKRVQEALALATKVAHAPFTIAELCWSDDPEYTTGYVSSKKLGYARISPLKQQGSESGGRVFFVSDKTCIDAYINYLEKHPVLIQEEGSA